MADMYLGNESGGFDLVGTTNIKNIDFEEAKISKEDYENLSEEEQKKGVYLVTGLDDIEDGGGRADLISYDNTNSGLGSTNVQGAIDELNKNFISFDTELKTITLEKTTTNHIHLSEIFTIPDGYKIVSLTPIIDGSMCTVYCRTAFIPLDDSYSTFAFSIRNDGGQTYTWKYFLKVLLGKI